MHGKINSNELDLTHVTDRRGSSQTLVRTKTGEGLLILRRDDQSGFLHRRQYVVRYAPVHVRVG